MLYPRPGNIWGVCSGIWLLLMTSPLCLDAQVLPPHPARLTPTFQALELGHLEAARETLLALPEPGAPPLSRVELEAHLERYFLLAGLDEALSNEAEAPHRWLKKGLSLAQASFGPFDWHTRDMERQLEWLGKPTPRTEKARLQAETELQQLFLSLPLLEARIPAPQRSTWIESLLSFGELYRAGGALRTAERLLLRAQEAALRWEESSDSLLPRIWADLAGVYEDMGHFELAQDTLARQVNALQQQRGENHPEVLKALEQQAALYERVGEPGKAEPLYRRCLALAKTVYGTQDPAEMSARLEQLQADLRAGRTPTLPPGGIQFPGPEVKRAELLLNVSTFYINLQQADHAVSLAEEAVQLYQKWFPHEHHPDMIKALNNLGGAYLAAGRLDQAEKTLEHTEALATAMQLQPVTLAAKQNLATLYRQRDEGKRAEALWLELLDTHTQLHGPLSPEVQEVQQSLGALYLAWGDHEKAQNALDSGWRSTLTTTPPDHPSRLLYHAMQAGLSLDRGDPARALEQAREGLMLSRRLAPRQRVSLSRSQRLTLKRSQAEERATWLEITADLPSSVQLSPEEVWAGVIDWKGDRLLDALSLRTAAQNPEFAQQLRQYYALGDTLAQLRLKTPVPLAPSAREAGTAPSEPLDLIEALQAQRAQLEKELAASSPAYQQFQRWRAQSTMEIRSSLNSSTVLIDFYLYERRGAPVPEGGFRVPVLHLTAFVVHATSVQRVELGPFESIQSELNTWQRFLNVPGNSREERASAERVRRLLWTPLESALGQPTHIQIVPDGVLSGVPLAALPGKSPGQDLLDAYVLSTRPVPQQPARAILPSPPEPESLLVVGEVAFGNVLASDGGLSSPHSEKTRLALENLQEEAAEGEAVMRMFRRTQPRGNVLHLKGEAATEPAVRDAVRGRRTIHISTHGLLNSRALSARLALTGPAGAEQAPVSSPASAPESFELLGALALAGVNEERTGADDGLLTAQEIAGLPLESAALVTLSACNSGRGRIFWGEGQQGLQQAFLEAGAETVVWTLWDVNVVATRLLMIRFYQNLWRHQQPPAEALRGAQQWVRDEGGWHLNPDYQGIQGLWRRIVRRHPPPLSTYFWAGFGVSSR